MSDYQTGYVTGLSTAANIARNLAADPRGFFPIPRKLGQTQAARYAIQQVLERIEKAIATVTVTVTTTPQERPEP